MRPIKTTGTNQIQFDMINKYVEENGQLTKEKIISLTLNSMFNLSDKDLENLNGSFLLKRFISDSIKGKFNE